MLNTLPRRATQVSVHPPLSQMRIGAVAVMVRDGVMWSGALEGPRHSMRPGAGIVEFSILGRAVVESAHAPDFGGTVRRLRPRLDCVRGTAYVGAPHDGDFRRPAEPDRPRARGSARREEGNLRRVSTVPGGGNRRRARESARRGLSAGPDPRSAIPQRGQRHPRRVRELPPARRFARRARTVCGGSWRQRITAARPSHPGRTFPNSGAPRWRISSTRCCISVLSRASRSAGRSHGAVPSPRWASGCGGCGCCGRSSRIASNRGACADAYRFPGLRSAWSPTGVLITNLGRRGTILQAEAPPPDTQTAKLLRSSSEKSRWQPVAAGLRQLPYFHRLISGDTHEARHPRHGPGSRGHRYGVRKRESPRPAFEEGCEERIRRRPRSSRRRDLRALLDRRAAGDPRGTTHRDTERCHPGFGRRWRAADSCRRDGRRRSSRSRSKSSGGSRQCRRTAAAA